MPHPAAAAPPPVPRMSWTRLALHGALLAWSCWLVARIAFGRRPPTLARLASPLGSTCLVAALIALELAARWPGARWAYRALLAASLGCTAMTFWVLSHE